MRRLSIPLLILAVAALVAAPAGAKAKKCPSSKPYKVGKFCVKMSTFDGKGNVALIVPTRNKTGRITGQGVRIGLRAPTTATCTDGTSQQYGGVSSLASPILPLKGAAFSGSTTVAGATAREIRGHFTASNKVLVELYRQVNMSATGATCTAEWRNITITGK